MKLGLSLAGGGIKGASHIGAIKALEEANIKFDYISGTSSGSIVASLYASGYNSDEIYKIFKKYANEIHYIDFENIKRFTKNLFGENGFVIDGLNSGTKIKKLINEMCKHKGICNIKQIKMPIIIPAVNIKNEELYVFSNTVASNKQGNIRYINDIDIGTAVQASCSYPGIFSPCRFDDKLLIDGGIAENLPWRETKKSGADKVLSIVFKTSGHKCCDNVVDVLSKSFSILCHELYKYEWDGTDYLLKIDLPSVGLLERNKMDLLYEEGYKQTKEKISDIKQKLNI